MTEPAPREKTTATAAEPSPPAAGQTVPAPEAEAAASNQLSAEEQMVRFEQALKESDWGHQPC